MWKNVVELDWLAMAVWHMYIACWILKATDTNTQNISYIFVLYINSGFTIVLRFYI